MTDVTSSTDRATARGADRARDLLARMTLEEKLAQLVGFWDQGDGDAVAPLQGDFAGASTLEAAVQHGIGQLTRVYGTTPVDPVERAAWLWAFQRRLVEETRLGIPALVHEECLTGLAAWRAATFPTPLAWGASFDPDLVHEMAAAIGASMRELGVHQGLAPVLDVVRDPAGAASRSAWARTRTSSACSGRPTSPACRPAGSTPPSSTSSATPPPPRVATSPPCTPARASSPTCCCRRSRWPSSTAGCGR